MADGANGVTRYPMRVVMSRTGLTADVLRAWERRYGAVQPYRSPAGQRLYSDRDVERLLLLRRATVDGHSIGAIATLDDRALEALLARSPATEAAPPHAELTALLREAMHATERLDASALEAILRRATMALGATPFVDDFAPRFLVEVGDRWHAGTVGVAHEHLATSLVRRALDRVIEAFAVSPRAPRLVVATPAGEQHELGAMLVAAAAAQEGWRVVYLGASLPAAEIAAAAQEVHARAVALSLVAAQGHQVVAELRATARALPEGTTLLVGGRTAACVADETHARGVSVLDDIAALRRALRAIRSVSGPDAQPDPPAAPPAPAPSPS
ncbi:MAG TPA: cobalamin-dependent protein [Gemmatimonadaceae bacterium]|nr:cobalamin-dependent protein [Gemmatimonadaceae bacterium]